MSIPLKDSLLVPYSTNMSTRITATPATFGLVIGQATTYSGLHTTYVNAYNALVEARANGTRSESLTATKDTAKAALIAYGRELYDFVQANSAVSDADKILLGIHIRDNTPTPPPVPTEIPKLNILSINGRTMKVRFESDELGKRGKPPGVKGCTLLSFVGNEPSEDPGAWKFEGNSTKTEFTVTFPATLEPGTKVWLTGFWSNTRNQSGTACAPVQAYISYNGFSLAA